MMISLRCSFFQGGMIVEQRSLSTLKNEMQKVHVLISFGFSPIHTASKVQYTYRLKYIHPH